MEAEKEDSCGSSIEEEECCGHDADHDDDSRTQDSHSVSASSTGASSSVVESADVKVGHGGGVCMTALQSLFDFDYIF